METLIIGTQETPTSKELHVGRFQTWWGGSDFLGKAPLCPAYTLNAWNVEHSRSAGIMHTENLKFCVEADEFERSLLQGSVRIRSVLITIPKEKSLLEKLVQDKVVNKRMQDFFASLEAQDSVDSKRYETLVFLNRKFIDLFNKSDYRSIECYIHGFITKKLSLRLKLAALVITLNQKKFLANRNDLFKATYQQAIKELASSKQADLALDGLE